MLNKEILDKTNELLNDDIRIFDYVQVTRGFNSKQACQARTYEYTLRTEVLRPSKKHPKYAERDSWTFDKAEQSRFREILKQYEGTRKYHNFTKGGSFDDASCARYIIDITLSEPFEQEGMEFVRITLKGQSFILHQIRKMIGTASIIFRDGAPAGVIHKFMEDMKIILPMVPGLGLTLLKCHFDSYEKKHCKNGVREPITFLNCQDAVDQFKKDQIYSAIYKKEKEENM